MSHGIDMNANDSSPHDPQTARESGRWSLRLILTGFAVTVVGVTSYYLYFFQFPALRDTPWVNVPLSLLGVVLAGMGWVRILRAKGQWARKGLGAVGFALTLGFAGLFNWYVFDLSYHLPDGARAPEVGAWAPEFALADQHGKTVALADFRGKKVVVVFYRGFW